MLSYKTQLLYKEIASRYVKVTWTHKMHMCQADLYHAKSECIQTIIGWLTALTAISTVASLLPILRGNVLAVITAALALLLSYFTFRYKDGQLDAKANECILYGAKLHNLRNQYASLMVDIKAEKLNDDEIIAQRKSLEEMEDFLYSQDQPFTTKEAKKLADKALKIDKESTTIDDELEAILPEHLKIV